MFIQSYFETDNLTINQRWSNVFVIVVAFAMLLYGFNLREQAYSSVTLYENIQAGIRAFYPSGWLLDTDGNYVFRVRDVKNAGYSTTIQLATLPSSDELTERNLIDQLALQRSQTFTDYSVISIESLQLPNGADAQGVLYTYVTRETSPFLEGIPSVVIGYDILTLRRGQAIVISFRAGRDDYDREFRRFQQFLSSLRF